MSLLTKWRPASLVPAEFQPFDLWHDFEESMRDWFEGNSRSTVSPMRLLPRANVAETDKEYLVSLELPGLDLNDVEVKLSGNELIVTGERKQKKEDKDKHFRRIETTYGAFERRFELPSDVRSDADSLKATFHNGMLEVKVPKREPKPVTKIPIKPM
ncbi:MAG TPA: Hsp20/alpha crystallin family protein [Planctomycetota bacterium]|nr:Hsp20/alpha crystallin family protein [Planctomycetota bacterium]